MASMQEDHFMVVDDGGSILWHAFTMMPGSHGTALCHPVLADQGNSLSLMKGSILEKLWGIPYLFMFIVFVDLRNGMKWSGHVIILWEIKFWCMKTLVILFWGTPALEEGFWFPIGWVGNDTRCLVFLPTSLIFWNPPPRDLIKRPSLGFMKLFDGRSFDKKFCQVFFELHFFKWNAAYIVSVSRLFLVTCQQHGVSQASCHSISLEGIQTQVVGATRPARSQLTDVNINT